MNNALHKNGKITLGREEIQIQNSEIQAPTNKQAKHSKANLQETLLLSKQPKPSKRKRESKEDEEKWRRGLFIDKKEELGF